MRIGGAATHHTGDFFGQGSHPWRIGSRGIGVVQRRRAAKLTRCRGEAGFVSGIVGRCQKVSLRQILKMHEGIDSGGTSFKRRARGRTILTASISKGAIGKPGFCRSLCGRRCKRRDRLDDANAIFARRRAEDARACDDTVGIFFVRLVASGERRGSLLEQHWQRREDIAEQARDPQGHVDARPAERGQGCHLKTRHALGRGIPDRRHPHQLQRHGEFLACAAHGRRSPEIQHDVARIIAVVLEVTGQQCVGQSLALLCSVPARHRPAIDREEIAAGWQHVAPAAPG